MSQGRVRGADAHADRLSRGRQQRAAVEEKRRRQLEAAEQGWDDAWADDHLMMEGKLTRLNGSRVEGSIGHRDGPGRAPQWADAAGNDEALTELQGGWGTTFFDRSGTRESMEKARLSAVRDAAFGSATLLQDDSYVANTFYSKQLRRDRVRGGAINYSARYEPAQRAFADTSEVLGYMAGHRFLPRVPTTPQTPSMRSGSSRRASGGAPTDRGARGHSMGVDASAWQEEEIKSAAEWETWEQKWGRVMEDLNKAEQEAATGNSVGDPPWFRTSFGDHPQWNREEEQDFAWWERQQSAENSGRSRARRPEQTSERRPGSAGSRGSRNGSGKPGVGTGEGGRRDARPKPQVKETKVKETADTFEQYQKKWVAFELKLTQGGHISVKDIPFPPESGTISGVRSTDDAITKKRKLKEALLRWHPDKFQKILQKCTDKDGIGVEVANRVSEVAKRLISERAAHK